MICRHHSVLEKHRPSLDRGPVLKSRISPSVRDAMQLEDVSVTGDDVMNFHRVSSISDNLRLRFEYRVKIESTIHCSIEIICLTVVMKDSGS